MGSLLFSEALSLSGSRRSFRLGTAGDLDCEAKITDLPACVNGGFGKCLWLRSHVLEMAVGRGDTKLPVLEQCQLPGMN